MSTDAAASAAPIKLTDLRPKMKLQGKVTKVELYGAFVDVGAEREGLLHVSQMGMDPATKVQDVLSAEQEVTVWVRKVDAEAGRIDLTAVEPLELEWDELKVGLVVAGKVAKLEKFGAFVDIGAERNGFIHVRELASGYVADPADVVKVGDQVEAKVISLDRRRRRIDLSLKALDDAVPDEQEAEEAPATALELALRQAMMDSGPAARAPSRRRKKSRADRADLDAVLERTRRQHTAGKA